MKPLRYRIEEQIGAGGYGQVVRARLDDGGVVAIKRLFPDRVDGHRRESLLREAQLAAKLAHPNIVPIHRVDEDSTGHVCLVMELVDGIDLAQLLHWTRVPLASSIYITRALLAALEHAHEVAHIVHRDLAPQNVLISWEGEVKLTDFGIAKARGLGPTNTGQVRGRAHYVSPEQFHGRPVQAHSDLFALGVILYQLITGCVPYDEASDHMLAFMSGQFELMPLAERCPEVSPEIAAVVMRLLARDAAERYQSARDVLAALPDWPHGRGELVALLQQLRDAEASPRHSRGRKRARFGRALVAALVLGAVLGIGGTMLHAQLTQPDATPAASDEPHRVLDRRMWLR